MKHQRRRWSESKRYCYYVITHIFWSLSEKDTQPRKKNERTTRSEKTERNIKKMYHSQNGTETKRSTEDGGVEQQQPLYEYHITLFIFITKSIMWIQSVSLCCCSIRWANEIMCRIEEKSDKFFILPLIPLGRLLKEGRKREAACTSRLTIIGSFLIPTAETKGEATIISGFTVETHRSRSLTRRRKKNQNRAKLYNII